MFMIVVVPQDSPQQPEVKHSENDQDKMSAWMDEIRGVLEGSTGGSMGMTGGSTTATGLLAQRPYIETNKNR